MNTLRQSAIRLGLLLMAVSFGYTSPLSAQSKYKRTAVIEEFTGTWCFACPSGAMILDSMEGRMGDELIILSWHLNDEFTIKGGTDLEKASNVTVVPSAMVHRGPMVGAYVPFYINNPWYVEAVKQANVTPDVDFRIVNMTRVGNKIDFDVEIAPYDLSAIPKETAGKYDMVIVVSEDNIVAPQQDGANVIEDYVHNDVPRKTLTSVFGDVFNIGTKTPLASYPFRKHYSFLVDNSWKAENLRIKAFAKYKPLNTTLPQVFLNADQTGYAGTFPESVSNAIWTVAPRAEQEWDPKTPVEIIWSKSGEVSAAKIEYSIDGGSTWSEVVASTTVSPYKWTAPEAVHGQSITLRITSTTDATVTSTSEPFNVSVAVPATIAVSQPTAGEMLTAGSTYTVIFDVAGPVAPQRTLEYSLNGSTWTKIEDLDGETSYNWLVPNIDAPLVTLRVTDGNGAVGMSGQFSIAKAGQIQTLTSADIVDNQVAAETPITITWSASGNLGTTFTLSYSTDNQIFTDVATDIATSASSYTWTTLSGYHPTVYLKLTSETGATKSFGPFQIGAPASVGGSEASSLTAIEGNYPNPFRVTTKIDFLMAEQGHATLSILNVLGQEVATLVDATRAQGVQTTEFDASKLAPGTYIARLVANGTTSEIKLTVSE